MARYFLLAILPVLLLLSGCAGKNKNNDMQANLEPELWDTSLILKDLKRGRPLTEQEKKALASRGSIQFNLGVTDNEEVQMFLQYFSMDRRGTMDRWLQRAEPYLPYVRAVLASYDLPQDLIALPFIESGYSNLAYSPAGAGGMWQFMPYTARRFGLTVDWWVDERRDPYKATVAAAKYLSKLYQMFGDWNLALAAYNAGEGKISKVMAASGQCDFFDIAKNPKLLKEETRHYVPKFLAVLKIFQNLETLGFKKVNWQAGPNLKEVPAPGGTDLRALAQACDMSWEQFREYNPGFRRQVSPPEATVNVYVPVAKEQTAVAYLKNPGSTPPSGSQTYLVDAGDTWWSIARKTGMPVAELRQLNASMPETPPQGQSIRIALSASSADNVALAEAPDACAPRPLSAAKSQRHRVSKGESIGSIAKRYGVPTQELLAANHMNHPRSLHNGSWIVIPSGTAASASPAQIASASRSVPQGALPGATPAASGGSHRVQRGESLSAIAAQYGVGTAELMAANHMRSGKELMAGQRLTIPGRGSAPGKPQLAQVQDAAPAKSTPSGGRTPQPLAASSQGASPSRNFAQNAKPASQPAAPAKPALKSVSYTVAPGETVWAIAKKFNVEPSSLMAWNNMKSPSALQAGSQLTIHKQ